MILVLAEGILFGFGGNKMAQLGQGHQKPVVAKPVQVQVWWWNFFFLFDYELSIKALSIL